ncbi:protein kinase-like domain-containing protein [Artemisia annua]|uniref:non-specific serine/threonine protein kinase n=1 Tax=Artemisia annua TaxID=35608 RepID=A0A2U1L9C0_ARTAN|nr:protein kinase-like domain-containing protein [Artemisia annua]
MGNLMLRVKKNINQEGAKELVGLRLCKLSQTGGNGYKLRYQISQEGCLTTADDGAGSGDDGAGAGDDGGADRRPEVVTTVELVMDGGDESLAADDGAGSGDDGAGAGGDDGARDSWNVSKRSHFLKLLFKRIRWLDKISSFAYDRLFRPYSLDEIQLATQNFSENLVIGKGGFGSVYQGTIVVNGENVYAAIKRLESSSNQGAHEFWSEIQMLSKLRHCNLVSLIGYCNDDSEMILLYEYMTHRSLSDHLHTRGTNLSWVQRIKISIGAARGLQYLHSGTSTQHGVIHRDVKSSNILLDEHFSAKISDFGLSKIGPRNPSGTYVNTHIKGTFGYFDPEYFLTGRLTPKSDVFAFGVVLFELLSGRVALAENLDDDKCSLAKWAYECVEQKRPNQIVDCNIERQIFPKCVQIQTFTHQIQIQTCGSDSDSDPLNKQTPPKNNLLSLHFPLILFCFPEAQRVRKPSRNNEDAIECSPSLKEGGIDHHRVIPLGELLDHLHQVSAVNYEMFRIVSGELSQGIQNLPESTFHYANENALFIAKLVFQEARNWCKVYKDDNRTPVSQPVSSHLPSKTNEPSSVTPTEDWGAERSLDKKISFTSARDITFSLCNIVIFIKFTFGINDD